MATSSSVNFSLTARQIATSALELIGVVGIGETPSAADATKALEQLNLMVKTWGADPDPKLWLKTEASVTLAASTVTYTASPVTLARKVLSARRRTGTGTAQSDIPIDVLSRQEYEDKANKLSTGEPLGVYLDPQRATRTLYVWPAPDATIAAATTVRITYLRVIEDLDSLDDDFDLPQEWLEVLEYGLAARLSVPYDINLTNPAKAQKIEERAASLYAQLSAFDEEDGSVFMQPCY
jgi:hypothetical protein